MAFLSAASDTIALCRQDFDLASLATDHHSLQAAVLEKLPHNQDVLHARSYHEWFTLLADPHRHFIRVRQGLDLVGQACILNPDQDRPDADMIDMDLPDSPEKLSTLCTVMSHPNHRGGHIMRSMAEEWKRVAMEQNRPHLLGCITRTNPQSWSQFLKIGLHITGAGFDPSDNSTVYYAHLNMKAPTQYNDQDTVTVEPTMPLPTLQSYMNNGYIGVAGEKDKGLYTGRLIMARRL